MRTTRKKLNLRMYWACQAQIYVNTCINKCINGYKDRDSISKELNLAYQNLEMSWSNIATKTDRKFISSKIRSNQKLIQHLGYINYYISKYIEELNDITPLYHSKNNHLEIDKDLGEFFIKRAMELLEKILKETN